MTELLLEEGAVDIHSVTYKYSTNYFMILLNVILYYISSSKVALRECAKRGWAETTEVCLRHGVTVQNKASENIFDHYIFICMYFYRYLIK